jgi:hypothetical protein
VKFGFQVQKSLDVVIAKLDVQSTEDRQGNCQDSEVRYMTGRHGCANTRQSEIYSAEENAIQRKWMGPLEFAIEAVKLAIVFQNRVMRRTVDVHPV